MALVLGLHGMGFASRVACFSLLKHTVLWLSGHAAVVTVAATRSCRSICLNNDKRIRSSYLLSCVLCLLCV